MTALRPTFGIVMAAGMCMTLAACRNPGTVTVRTEAREEIVLTLAVQDDAPAESTPAVTAFTVHVDGAPAHEVLVVPGSRQTNYETLIGPLAPGHHNLEIKPSTLWPPHASVRLTRLSTRQVPPGAAEHDLFRLAPAIVLRADTVGRLNDLPMLLYVENRFVDDARVLRYTTVFTNEDGGTETRALFARWGRACDIEQIYEARLDGEGRRIEETFQGPDHKILPFRGSRMGDHPILTVATRNNMVVDRVLSPDGKDPKSALVRPVPLVVVPDESPRESILDSRPWLQRLSGRELREEGKAFDPRDFIYLDAKLRLRNAAVAAQIETADGQSVASDLGNEKLRVTRDGWVRVAVPLARETKVTAAGWICSDSDKGRPLCEIGPSIVFRLGDDFAVQPLQVPPTGSPPVSGPPRR